MKKIALSLALGATFFTFMPAPALAKVQYGEGEVIVSKNEIVSDDLYISGKTIRIEGKVEGDLYAAGESIFVTGDVSGDATLVGGSLNLEGSVGQDAYLIGQTITLSGAKITDSLHLAGMNLSISADSLLGGSLLMAGETLKNDATVARSLLAAGKKIKQDAPVLGEARLAGESIYLGPKTSINKDLTYFLAPDNGKIDSQATVKGSTHAVTEPAEWRNRRLQDQQNQQEFWIFMRVWSYVGMLLVGAIAIWLLQKPLNQAVAALNNRSLPALGSGLLLTILTPPALLLLAFTVIGMPLALMLLLLYLLAFYLGKLVVALALARTVASGFSLSKLTPLMEMFIGVTLLHLLKLIPVGGYFLSLLATWIGVGAIYLSLKKSR